MTAQDDSGMIKSSIKQQAQNQFKKLNSRINNSNIFLPRTGIEQPFMKDRPRFKETHKDFEPICNTNNSMSDEFARLDNEKIMN